MIYKAKMPFTSSRNLKYGWGTSSLLHGLIMESIDTEYAEILHSGQLRVFSQSVISDTEINYWIISTFSDEAYERILLPVLALEKAEITQKDDIISFEKAEITCTSFEKLFAAHYIANEPIRRLKLDFLTPASFKAGGKYINIPDPGLILSGLARRFDNDCDIHDTIYDALFDEIEQRVSFSSFNIRSAQFPIEQVRIPAFRGSVTLWISGNETFCRYINMICEYASYSGIGIKTALGMGQVTYSPLIKKEKEEIF
ncbi:MAG TPA: CRISPR system precrRNA processing endoribonuclease RAMP protein Cas6 [Ruminococcus sp.]|nr:CRISPR system precrRNA processing endoribonuclease RAMP protein Cas6 [Ruminococcus sp.]